MNSQQVLEESIEKMGVWMTKHPTGTLTVQSDEGVIQILPYPGHWVVRWKNLNEVLPYETNKYEWGQVADLVHKILTWSRYGNS